MSFYHVEAPACESYVMRPMHGTEAENRTSESVEEDNFPVLPPGKITNPTEDDMDVIRCIFISIDDDN